MVTSGSYWLVTLFGVICFWLLPLRLHAGFLALLSIAFLSTIDLAGCAAFVLWSLAFFLLAPFTRGGGTRRLLPVLILAILGYLAFFKYAPPLIEAAFGQTRWSQFVAPVGLSYFTFKLIHYVVEVSRRNIRDRSLSRFLCYIFMFPAFTAGPIERFDHFLAEAEDRLQTASMVTGLRRIAIGLIKKFVLVELVFEQLIPGVRGHPAEITTTSAAWFLCITSFLTVYLDFSAYSDIAIGTCRLFGLKILENFNFPILAQNIGEFWKRWHMTLVGWCRSYVYLPTIGLTRNPYLAVYALCLAVGLWHAGTVNYAIWGLYHATGVVVFQTWKRSKIRRRIRMPKSGVWMVPGIVATLLFVSSSFAFTGRSAAQSLRLFARLWCIDLD